MEPHLVALLVVAACFTLSCVALAAAVIRLPATMAREVGAQLQAALEPTRQQMADLAACTATLTRRLPL